MLLYRMLVRDLLRDLAEKGDEGQGPNRFVRASLLATEGDAEALDDFLNSEFSAERRASAGAAGHA